MAERAFPIVYARDFGRSVDFYASLGFEEHFRLGAYAGLRRGDLAARRQAIAFLRSQDVVKKLFDDVGPRFAERPGGYARIVKIGPRPGDSADMVYLELVDHQP